MTQFTFNYWFSNIKPMIPFFITVESKWEDLAEKDACEKIGVKHPEGLNLRLSLQDFKKLY
jgi:hypothetical protein